MPKSPNHILRDTLERLDADLTALTPAQQREFLDSLASEIEERLIELSDEGETAKEALAVATHTPARPAWLGHNPPQLFPEN